MLINSLKPSFSEDGSEDSQEKLNTIFWETIILALSSDEAQEDEEADFDAKLIKIIKMQWEWWDNLEHGWEIDDLKAVWDRKRSAVLFQEDVMVALIRKGILNKIIKIMLENRSAEEEMSLRFITQV